MLWGNGAAASESSGSAVFNAANGYVSVLHMNETLSGNPLQAGTSFYARPASVTIPEGSSATLSARPAVPLAMNHGAWRVSLWPNKSPRAS